LDDSRNNRLDRDARAGGQGTEGMTAASDDCPACGVEQAKSVSPVAPCRYFRMGILLADAR
jgi:hypothetical protein